MKVLIVITLFLSNVLFAENTKQMVEAEDCNERYHSYATMLNIAVKEFRLKGRWNEFNIILKDIQQNIEQKYKPECNDSEQFDIMIPASISGSDEVLKSHQEPMTTCQIDLDNLYAYGEIGKFYGELRQYKNAQRFVNKGLELYQKRISVCFFPPYLYDSYKYSETINFCAPRYKNLYDNYNSDNNDETKKKEFITTYNNLKKRCGEEDVFNNIIKSF